MPQNRKKEVEARRAEISRLYLMGYTGAEIADHVGVSPSQVSRDLKILTQRWKDESIRDISERKAKDLAELEHVKRELWTAWMKSKEALKKQKRKKSNSGTGKGYEENSQERTERLPDARYMSELLRVIKQVADLLGYNEAQKINLNFDQMDSSQIDNLIDKIISDD